MSAREHIFDAVQASIDLDDDMPEGSMLKGYVLIAEWVSPDDRTWLSQTTAGPQGDPLPDWTMQGYLHNVLNDWPTPPDD